MLREPGYGLQRVLWHGVEPKALVDINGRIFGVLAGRPQGAADWEENVHLPACKAFEKAERGCSFDHHDKEPPRRGPFPALDVGVSHGGGQLVGSLLFLLFSPLTDGLSILKRSKTSPTTSTR